MADKNEKIIPDKAVNNSASKEWRGLLVPCLCAGIIALITYFVFSPSLKNGFTNVDDDAYVLYNPLVINDGVNIIQLLKTPIALNYHPLTMLSLAWNYQSGKLNPYGYHLENVLLHVLNTILVFFFIFLLTKRSLLMASIVALFFGIHPMHVESVSWVSERKDVLYVFFFLCGLITYLFYHQSKKIIWYMLTLIFYILSCLSKGMAVVFPIILLLIDYLLKVKWDRKMFVEKIIFFILSIGFGVLAFIVQKGGGAMTDESGTSFMGRIMVASYGLVMYIVKLFVPFHLAMMYPHFVDDKGNMPFMFYLSPFIVLAGVAIVYFLFRKNKPVVFGLLFYLCTVVLVLQFFSVGSSVMADRYSYLSYIGLLFVVAYVINNVWYSNKKTLALLKYPLGAVVIVAAVLFSYQTYARTQVWKNTKTLWTDEMNKYPGARFEHMEKLIVKSAVFYQNEKKYDLAADNWNCAIMLVPDDTFALYNRAILRYQLAKYDSALTDYNRAIQLGLNRSSVFQNRALAFVQLKDFASAEKDFASAIKLDSNNRSSYFNRALYYNQTNQDEKALTDFNKCLQFKPMDDTVYNWIGVSYHKLKRYDNAIVNFNKAIEINPGAGQYMLNRSFSENAMNRKGEAKQDALKAQELGEKLDAGYLKSLGIQ